MSAFSVLSSGISFLVVYRLAQGTFFSGLEGDANQPVPEHELAPVTPPVQRRFRTDDVGTGSRWRNSERASPFVEDGVQTQSAPRERSLRFDDALDAFSERASFDSRSSRRVFSELGVESSQSQERQRSGGHLRRYVNIGSAVFSRDDFNRESLENVPASLDFSSNPNGSTLDREPSAVSDSEMEPPERKPDNRRSGLLPSKLPLRKLFGQRPAHDSKRKGSPHRMSAEGKRHLAPALVHQSALGDELPASEEQRSSREASGLSENLTPVAVQVESLRIVQSWENMRVTDKSEIIAEDFCEGMLSLLSVIDALGPAFRIIKIDIRNHVGGIRRSCTKHGCRTLQRLVDAESNRTSHWLNSTGMGEGTEHILWMKRAMQFVYMLLQMFVEDADLELCVYHSYRKTLRPCHPYIVRKVAENLHRFVPNRTGFVRRIHADEQFVLVQMKRFLKAIEPRLDILVDLYNSNNLERYCRRTCADLRQLALVCLKDQIGDELDD
ncbi:hypothetical protein CCYA_CCYA04G1205 [Cyanidiococcus yangmingshanensis]|nr:hypothetical protein CCYA_CCYA04G1205 [Cyanidiococcus yangmingshanensis]